MHLHSPPSRQEFSLSKVRCVERLASSTRRIWFLVFLLARPSEEINTVESVEATFIGDPARLCIWGYRQTPLPVLPSSPGWKVQREQERSHARGSSSMRPNRLHNLLHLRIGDDMNVKVSGKRDVTWTLLGVEDFHRFPEIFGSRHIWGRRRKSPRATNFTLLHESLRFPNVSEVAHAPPEFTACDSQLRLLSCLWLRTTSSCAISSIWWFRSKVEISMVTRWLNS